jgi:hypothetical protein
MSFQPALRTLRLGAFLLSALALCACTSVDLEAKVRLLNASQDYGSLDLYAGDNRYVSGIGYGTASDYAGINAGNYAIAIAAHDASSRLVSTTKKLEAQSHHAYVGFGRSGSFAAIAIDEDQDAAASGKARLLAINAAMDAGDVDIYVTDSATVLTDTTPLFSDVASGTAGDDGYVTLASGTYRLRVTAAGSPTDVRLDIAAFTLGSKQVAALVVADTPGGVLVNGLLLRQQEDLVSLTNPNARVRAVAGITDGSTITTSLGGTTLASNAAARTIGAYQQVAAGSRTLSLAVDGDELQFAEPTLAAGGDYSLLVWEADGSVEVTLIADDNRPPRGSSDVKIRLLNAMSGFNEAISLSVDYSPIAEGIALGRASTPVELSSSTGSVLDVTNASTSAPLFSLSGTTLTANGVYSLFMFGNTGSAAGRLRRER